MAGEEWTLAELVQRAARALAAADVRAPNGRVTEVPDARTIRWYATIGLVDKPTFRGRIAYYGERHLRQLVAVKRLQAQGNTLAQVQSLLAGTTDAVLRSLVGDHGEPEPTAAAFGATSVAPKEAEQGRFWAAAALLPSAQHSASPIPASSNPASSNPASSNPASPSAAPQSPAPKIPASQGLPGGSPAPHLLYGVPLAEITLLLPVRPDDDDLAAIHNAAAPLLDLLATRGLLTPRAEGR